MKPAQQWEGEGLYLDAVSNLGTHMPAFRMV